MNDDDVIPQLLCDVELVFTGPNTAALNKRAADVLRRLPDSIEGDDFESGHHDVNDSVGKKVGTVYIDYSGEIV